MKPIQYFIPIVCDICSFPLTLLKHIPTGDAGCSQCFHTCYVPEIYRSGLDCWPLLPPRPCWGTAPAIAGVRGRGRPCFVATCLRSARPVLGMSRSYSCRIERRRPAPTGTPTRPTLTAPTLPGQPRPAPTLPRPLRDRGVSTDPSAGHRSPHTAQQTAGASDPPDRSHHSHISTSVASVASVSESPRLRR